MNGWRVGLAILVITVVLIAPLVAPFDPLVTAPADQLAPPSPAHLFGTDLLGRDVWSRVLHGGRATTVAALAALGLCLAITITARMFALMGGRGLRGGLNILANALLPFPAIVLALTFTAILGNSRESLIAASAIAQTAPLVRVWETLERQVATAEHIDAARSLGGSRLHVWRVHVIPTIAPTLLAAIGTTFTRGLLLIAGLGFLGFGGEVSAPEWGRMLYEGRQVMRVAPWAAIAPGLAITLLVMIINGALRESRRA